MPSYKGHTDVMDLLIASGAIAQIDEVVSTTIWSPKQNLFVVIFKDTIDMEPVQTQQSHKGQSSPKSINPAQHKYNHCWFGNYNHLFDGTVDVHIRGKSPASIYISSPRDFKKVEEHPSTTAQEVSKVVIQIEEVYFSRRFLFRPQIFVFLLNLPCIPTGAQEKN